jgi:uncharacterized protein YrrD
VSDSQQATEQHEAPLRFNRPTQMVVRLRRLRRLPVIELSARRLGNVDEIYIDPVGGRLAMIDVHAGGGSPAIRIPGTRIRRVGAHAVMLAGRDDMIVPVLPEDEEQWIESENMIGMEVLDVDGDRTGFVNDVYLNRDTLAVEAFELETPWHEQRFRGPRLIMPNQVHSCGQDLMIVLPRGSRVALPATAPAMRSLRVGWEERTLRVPMGQHGAMADDEAPAARSA